MNIMNRMFGKVYDDVFFHRNNSLFYSNAKFTDAYLSDVLENHMGYPSLLSLTDALSAIWNNFDTELSDFWQRKSIAKQPVGVYKVYL